jgi:hypothetical protein
MGMKLAMCNRDKMDHQQTDQGQPPGLHAGLSGHSENKATHQAG